MGLAPGSAGSADSWDDSIPEPQAAASSPTFSKHYDARNKPPRAGTREEFDAFEDVRNTGYIRPTVARMRAKQPAKLYHPSLFATVFVPPPQLDSIPTGNLQGRQRGLVDERFCAEQEYREHRVVHSSPIKAITTPAKHPPRRPAGERQACPYVVCKLLHDDAHMDRFTHECKKGLFCDQRGDPAHNARFRHADFEDPDAALWTQEGWAAENKRSGSCAPIINASRLYQSMPALSCIPRYIYVCMYRYTNTHTHTHSLSLSHTHTHTYRGGFRPAGGTKSMTEMRELRAKRDDNVMLVVHGIHQGPATRARYTRLTLKFPASGHARVRDPGQSGLACVGMVHGARCTGRPQDSLFTKRPGVTQALGWGLFEGQVGQSIADA